MAQMFAAQVADWVRESENVMEAVVKDAAQAMMHDATETVVGISRGGAFQRGVIPVDTGFLAASLVSSASGGAMAKGQDSYVAAIAGMEFGDTVSFGWTADYAQHVHYGTSRMPGRFWVNDAVVGWQGYVDAAVRKMADV